MSGWFTLPDRLAIEMAMKLKAESGFRSPEPHRHSSGTPVQPYRLGGAAYRPNGVRERTRRRRQIERGQLRTESGLVRS